VLLNAIDGADAAPTEQQLVAIAALRKRLP
jgi:hypothetical protein